MQTQALSWVDVKLGSRIVSCFETIPTTATAAPSIKYDDVQMGIHLLAFRLTG